MWSDLARPILWNKGFINCSEAPLVDSLKTAELLRGDLSGYFVNPGPLMLVSMLKWVFWVLYLVANRQKFAENQNRLFVRLLHLSLHPFWRLIWTFGMPKLDRNLLNDSYSGFSFWFVDQSEIVTKNEKQKRSWVYAEWYFDQEPSKSMHHFVDLQQHLF